MKTLIDDYDPLKGKMLQVLDKDGNVNKALEPMIDDKRLLEIYRIMQLTRIADEKSVKLQRQGRFGAYPPSKGQEASQIGPAMALGDGDWMVWAFRELGALLLRGAPLWRTMLYWMGNEEGSRYGEGVNITPSSVPVGSQIPHAVGMSFASMYRKEKNVTLCFFGDGGSSEGDFHEGLNFAGVMKTPTVFVCQNNQWAISLPRELQTASKTIAQKAVSYGFPGILVDGNDVLALYSATKEAVERARRGEGPTLIESYTYRLSDHTTSDDATRYRTEQELKYWTERDPIIRFRIYLTGKGLWDDAKEAALTAELSQFVEEEVRKAESFAPPTLDDVFGHTYAVMPENLRAQLEFHRRDLGGKEGWGLTAMNMVQALNRAMDEEMARDPNVILLGEDVGTDGGVFRVSEGLFKKYGRARVIDTPLEESGIVGVSIGMAMNGLRPIAEIQFMGFIYPAFNQIISHAAKMRNRSRGRLTVPMVIRTPYGAGVKALEHHSESTESLFCQIPGLKVVVPSTPLEAKGLLTAAIRDPDPVIFLEPTRSYRLFKEEVPDGEYVIPLSKLRLVKQGKDVTVIGWGAMMPAIQKAVEQAEKEGTSCEVLDLRTLSPMDWEGVISSVRRTGRAVIVQEAPRTCGLAAEIAARIGEEVLLSLKAPVERVTAPDIVLPLPKGEDYYYVNAERIGKAIMRAMSF